MNISRERLMAEATATGFRPDVLEKVFYLIRLLEEINRHPFLSGKLSLKGGTALNLFLFDLPRLSVDIDLNYIGSLERSTMLGEKPKILDAVKAVCRREGLSVQRKPDAHAGVTLSCRYRSALGQQDNIKVDLNFMYRLPLWDPVRLDSRPVGSYQAKDILVLDEHELAAGKLTALLARRTSRDLFDAHGLLVQRHLNPERLRLGFVVYGAGNVLDWRQIVIDHIEPATRDLDSYLLPLLRGSEISAMVDASDWGRRLIQECRDALQVLLPLNVHESEFLNRLLEQGEIAPDLLTSDPILAQRIHDNPSLAWKAFNVRNHKSIPADNTEP